MGRNGCRVAPDYRAGQRLGQPDVHDVFRHRAHQAAGGALGLPALEPHVLECRNGGVNETHRAAGNHRRQSVVGGAVQRQGEHSGPHRPGNVPGRAHRRLVPGADEIRSPEIRQPLRIRKRRQRVHGADPGAGPGAGLEFVRGAGTGAMQHPRPFF